MKLKTNITLTKGLIDIAPLVDVVLLLLLFLIISSSFVTQTGVRISLPKSMLSGGIRSNQNVITIMNGSEGCFFFFNDQTLNQQQVVEKIKWLSENAPQSTIIIKADEQVPYGVVNLLMQEVMKNDLTVFMATQDNDV